MAQGTNVLLVNLTAIASTNAAALNMTDAQLVSTAVNTAAANRLVVGPLKVNQVEALAGATDVGGMCTDYSGNIYFTDVTNHCIVKVTESGVTSIVAGKAGTSGNNTAKQNVLASAARFNAPRGIACDKSNNLYIADTANNQIRIISQNGLVGMYAGNGAGTAGLVDASQDPTQSQFSAPYKVAIDNSGFLWVADRGNRALRKVAGGKVLTLAGNGAAASSSKQNVAANNHTALFGTLGPNCIAVDAKQNVFLGDTAFFQIKKYTPNGWIYLHSGSTQGTSLGTATTTVGKAQTCQYKGIIDMVANRYGYLFVLDVSGATQRVVMVDPNGVPANVVDFSNTTYTPRAIAISPANKVFVALVK